MNFPVIIKHRKMEAAIYAKSPKYPYYRLAYRVAGKRVVRSFQTFKAAKKEAENKVKELSTGNQTAALSAKEAADALLIRDALDNFRLATGHKVSALQAVTGYLEAVKLLPAGHNLADSVRGFLGTVAVLKRKLLSDAVSEFSKARMAKTIALPGKRPALSLVYVTNTDRQLTEFAETFAGTAVSDLAKTHVDAFLGAHSKLSAKSRNHLRTTLRMFLSWCVRHDYLSASHRLLEADSLNKEPLDGAAIEFYRPTELEALLNKSSGQLRAVIALQALAGLRLQEALRLDWTDVFGIPGHIEVSTAKSKTRQRRLVEICPSLDQWLADYRQKEGKVSDMTLNSYVHFLTKLRKSLKIKSRRNGLRHGFVTYHFALHQNENATSALAGNSPAMIHAHYKGLATKAEAEKWFNIMPVLPANVVVLDKAAI